MKKTSSQSGPEQVDAKLREFGDWRSQTLSRIRALIKTVEPDIQEACKWKKPGNPTGVPVWSLNGTICTGEIYKGKVKLTFAKGASLPDPSGLFNSSLDGKVRRAIDLAPQDELNMEAFKTLIRDAVTLNSESQKGK